ncbi:nucleoside hydrolase [Solirubrobacter sp. CPCC 204708]|uniref:Nucleoside hydrolase n=1 Tax=Solirubrobacter deserti TaxID=2282478 RepID=A0ABT4RL03_9ACTN|nr:nucleoside hydrolase [Solirubrobacter deserti]MBE2319032.1 nucleoside hydrolase [Solirubrobacter deserti]MDA0139244.1 nucleoside hydrolase [Solirubrobacter deserti]
MRRVILDMDVGIDDAIAILYLAAREDAEIVALGAVHGNCTAHDAARNALIVFETLGLDVPVALGAVKPLEQELSVASFVHGADGMGDAGFPDPKGAVTGEHAADQLIRLSLEHPGELDLLAVGPLTNLGVALRKDPEVLARLRSVVIMGGSGAYPPAGTLREVDANIDHDAAAAALVFAAPRNELVMVGVNVTSPAILDEEAAAALAASDTPAARLASAILPFYLGFYQHKWGRRVCSMHDPLAAGILVDPTYATAWRQGPVNVVSDGFMARAWLMEREDGGPVSLPVTEAPPTRVVDSADWQRFGDELVTRLTQA